VRLTEIARRVGAIASLAGLGAMSGMSPPERRAVPQRLVVRVAQFAYAPAELHAALGDTIEWENADIVPHTTAADSGAWSSGEVGVGSRFRYVAERAGRFPYHCAAHPVMHGLLVVE
jgi:plastocyanin